MVNVCDILMTLTMCVVSCYPRETLLIVNPKTSRNTSRRLDERVENAILEAIGSDVVKKVALNPHRTGKSDNHHTKDSLTLISPLVTLGGNEVKLRAFYPEATRSLSH
jgi:hypothetical protein